MDKKKLLWFIDGGGPNRLLTSLVSYWSFNVDASDAKNVNNGSLTGGASVGAGGIISNGLILAGNQYVSVTDSATLTFGNGTTDSAFSYSFWIKPTNFAQNAWMISKRAAGQMEYQITINITTGTVGFALLSLDGSNLIGTTTTEALTAGAWKHIVATYSGNSSASGLKVYFNGTLCTLTTSTSGTYVAMNNGTSAMMIGSVAQFPTTGEVIGTMDEVGLWSKELSQTDVTRLYNSGAGLPYTSFD